jgi:nitrite reductase/ring-hydroxylating ferredoxin subunit
MEVKKLNRSFFQRVLGRPATELPENNEFWSVSDGKITLDLSKAPALSNPAGAVRLEGNLPAKVLVVHGEDGQYRAYENKCTHMGRHVDPVPGTETVQCCSMNAATFDQDGNKIAGPAKKPLKTYPVKTEGGKLVIEIG